MCFGGIVMALREDVSLSKLLLVSVPVLAGAVGTIIAKMIPQFRRMQPKIDALNRIVREQITGIRVVRAFVREPDEARRFDVANVDLTETALRVGRLQAMMLPIVMVVFNASSVSVIWFGSHRIASGALDVGAMIAFLSYLMQILMAVMMVTFTSVMIPRAAVCAERISEVLETEPSINSVANPAPALSAPSAVVELRNVEYKYPGAELSVLHAITLRAEPGKTTAIIGSTGAGKTTLLDLIARLVDPTSGTVAIDGIDNRARELDALWARVGLVPQRPYLFTGTVASNLRYGDPNATDAELWAALEVAQAREFVTAMPLQLEAPIAQGGTNVSGGQRQRLSIARALLRKPAVYLFDDSFSALDLATESRLRAALRPHLRNATLIMVAQRVASIVDAEQIIVIDAGAIVGTGTHAELLQSSATYREIVESQRDMGAAA
jgi:ATP-binding cassette subfamily B multidrug efflux pump